jgi:DNA-binding HxlR family transcriptional regulator
MAALDLFGRRWTLRILWELRAGPVGFRELQAECDAMSSSVLNTRLQELAQARLVRRRDGAVALTGLGEAALAALGPLLD